MNDYGLVKILVLRFVIPEACMYGLRLGNQIGVHCILIVYLCVKVGGARWLTPTNLPPRSMHRSILLRGLIDFSH